MPASALLLAASIASLNLCTDEYLLLLARPSEIASVSYLSQDPLESPLWREARRHPANRGSIEQVLGHEPDLILTMGGGGRATSLIARRMNIRTLELAPTSSLDDVRTNLRAVAAALGDAERAQPWVDRLEQLRRTAPNGARDTIFLSGGGQSLGANSPGAEWLRLAGLSQRPLQGQRASLETLLARPPEVLVQSNYRVGQVSRGARWGDHPVVRNVLARRLTTDGRAWTCLGPLLIAEIEQLKAVR
ncbi:MAG TPA: ABC transporter substrate-binding protein [Sphingomicrobium sp.]|nr:ABC transporter substrate-binding protein [Sphingomicrobium sp.]